MTVESVTYISDLNAVNPAGTDAKSEGDDHIRNIKTGLDGSFPNFAGIAMTATEAELNLMDGVTATTAEINKLDEGRLNTVGSDVASATALSLGEGSHFDVTGTTTITSISTLGVGVTVTLQFDGALILTHHATDLILPSAANITTAAGDIGVFYEFAAGDWRCVSYTLATGKALAVTAPTAAQGSSMVLIEAKTLSAASTAEFVTGLNSTYDRYEFHLSGITYNTDQDILGLTVSTDAGSTWEATTYRHYNTGATDETTGISNIDVAATYIPITSTTLATAMGNAAGENMNGKIIIDSPSGSNYKLISGLTNYNTFAAASPTAYYDIRGQWQSTTAINGIKFAPLTTTFSGFIALYAFKKN